MQYDLKEICQKVTAVARRAGEFIAAERKVFTTSSVELKGRHNLVSYVDKTAEEIIVTALRDIVPSAEFITEEGTTAQAGADCGRYRWIIDPLDGTTNFVHGMPPYCVSIALADGDEVVVGVVYEVTIGECFYAWKDSAAYLDGEVIRVSQTDRMEDSLVITGLAYDTESLMRDFLRHFEYFNRHTHGARRLGSAATDLVYVAAGRAEAFYQIGLSPWDVAAGALIVRQAGGRVTDLKGGNDYLFGRQIIATNAMLYQEFFDKLNQQQ